MYQKVDRKNNYGYFMIHQTSSMCNPNIQNNILNWLNSQIKKYEKFQNAGGGKTAGEVSALSCRGCGKSLM